MNDIERLAAENARLKAILSKQGFTIKYTENGSINRIIAPRAHKEKHTAVYWAKKRGYSGNMSFVRKATKDRAIGLQKFKNTVERGELVKEAQTFLKSNGYHVPNKFFNRVPTYVLKNNDFYENVNAILNSTAESDAKDLEDKDIKYSIKTSVDRIKKLPKVSAVVKAIPKVVIIP